MGFFLLVLGTLVYNEIIEIPIEFMYVNTKRHQQELEASQSVKQRLLTDSEQNSANTESQSEEEQKLLVNN